MTPKYRFVTGQTPQVEQRMNEMYEQGWRHVEMIATGEYSVAVLMSRDERTERVAPQEYEVTHTMRNMLEQVEY